MTFLERTHSCLSFSVNIEQDCPRDSYLPVAHFAGRQQSEARMPILPTNEFFGLPHLWQDNDSFFPEKESVF